MKNNKNIVIIILVISVVLVGGYLLLIKKDDLTVNSKNIIGQLDSNKLSYGYPFIKYVYSLDSEINIVGGIYRFGDIDKDGLIGYSDFEILKDMITTGSYKVKEDTKKLADINEDGKINNSDLMLFNNYLKKNKEVEYDINSELLLYCLNDIDDSSNCIWKDSPSFKITSVKNYYAFVKHKNNERISNSTIVLKSDIE